GLLANPLLALVDDLFWHAHHNQTGWQLGGFAHQHLPLPRAITDLGTNVLQIQFLTTFPIQETHPRVRAGEKKAFLLFEPFQTAIAFIGDVEHSSRNAFLTQRTALIGLPTVRQQRSLQATLLEVPTHMELESSFALSL